MADMRGKHMKGRPSPRKIKKPLGRPPGSKTLFQYSSEELEGLPKKAKLLTPGELKVIKGLLSPEIQELKTEREKYQAIGVTQATYYKALRNPIIIETINEQALSMIRADAISLIRSSMKFAKEKASAFQDRKMIYQMLGYLGEDGNIINVNVEENKNNNPYEGMTREQLEVLIKNIENADTQINDVTYQEVENAE